MSGEAPASSDRPWHSYLTIDLFAHVLSRSIFHPYIAWLIPLCLRAITTPYHAPEFIAACLWASLVTLWAILVVFNHRLAYGVPREVDWDEEVVVITGGASGHGKILAETYGMRGASVAVLDLQKPGKESEGLAGVLYYRCDVGDIAAVEQVKEQIEHDVCRHSIDAQSVCRLEADCVSPAAWCAYYPHQQCWHRKRQATTSIVFERSPAQLQCQSPRSL